MAFARETNDAWWLSQHAAAYVVALDSVAQKGQADNSSQHSYVAAILSNSLKPGISKAQCLPSP